MKRSNYLLFLIILLLSVQCSTSEKQPVNPEKVRNESSINIMAYYVPASLPADSLPLEKLTHIIFSFTEIIDNKMEFKREGLSDKLQELVNASKKYPKLKVMIACGGWGGSGGFSEMASSKVTRSIFIESVIEFIKKYQIDGIDLDWEYPGLPGAGNPHKPEDKENFTSLVMELRKALDTYQENQILTFAAASWGKYFEFIELEKVMDNVDFINVMTYDFAGGGTPYTTHHTNFGKRDTSKIENKNIKDFIVEKELYNTSVESSVELLLSEGVKEQQIVIGGAFYGKIWKGVPPENNGLYQTNGGFEGYATYDEIRNEIIPAGKYREYWDAKASAPYLYNDQDSLFLTYDNPQSVKLKTQYVIDKNLGGIMFWQLSQDSKSFEMVESIFETAKPN